ncbi:MAG: hypothetical protein KAS32_00870 [Candidatus Peribacteraceae bacterium]|nr:hypothetical protein [Candidatus Peribacteraceae bacterium]
MPAKRPISLYHLMVLLQNVHVGASLNQVGFEDTDRTLEGLTRELAPMIYISVPVIESALWSCNLLDEQGKFWHPKDKTFEQFKIMIERNDTFNKDYNCFE